MRSAFQEINVAKKVKAIIKLQLPAGQANPAPPVGTALGQHGVNIMAFCKEYNERTSKNAGSIIPVEITVFQDRSFKFITKTPPTTDLIKKALSIEKGASAVGHDEVEISRGPFIVFFQVLPNRIIDLILDFIEGRFQFFFE